MKIFYDRSCLLHEVPARFPECPERLENVLSRLSSGSDELIDCRPSGDDWRPAVSAIHDDDYVRRFEAACRRGDGLLDSADNPISVGTWQGCVAAVEVTRRAARAMLEGNEMTFAAVRPPGHHAERGFAMGFCFFNNVAVAAQELIDRHGLERVAIFDFDVHHGNGTQHSFAARADVLYLSTHQYPFYPGTGAADERGVGDGEGATINIPLPAGSGDAVYLEVLEQQVLPALDSYAPDALLLSAGFDAYGGDPVGGMGLSRAAFHGFGRRLAELARRRCEGRLMAVLEGGYNLDDLGSLVSSHLDGLEGRELAP